MRRAFPAAVLLFCAAAGFALEPDYINPRIGVMIINNVVTGQVGAPDALVNTFGASLSFPFKTNPRFSFEPGLDFYWTKYEWGLDDRAHPTELETAEAAFVIGALLDAPVFWHWDISDRFQTMFGAGAAIVIRAAFRSSGASDSAEIQNIGRWFYQKLRWFYPSIQAHISYRLQERFTFELATRAFLPLFNVLDSEAPSFFDHSMINITMGMRIKLP